MREIILYRAPGERGDRAEEILKKHNIDYEVSMRNGVISFTMPRLDTPYGVYEGEDGIEKFVEEGISRYFKKRNNSCSSLHETS